MQAYRFDTYISENGTIALPMAPFLYNKKVRLVITPITETFETKDNTDSAAMNFVRKYSGALKGLPQSDADNDARYDYLAKKYNINNGYVSKEDLDDARNRYLEEKYQ